jgi:hypothetical protein
VFMVSFRTGQPENPTDLICAGATAKAWCRPSVPRYLHPNSSGVKGQVDDRSESP